MGQKTLGYTGLSWCSDRHDHKIYEENTDEGEMGSSWVMAAGRNPKLMTSLLWPGLKYPSAIHLVFTVVSTFYTVQFSREVGRYIFWYSRILKTFFQYLISLSIMSFFDQFCSPLILHNFAPLLFHQLLHQNSIFFTMVNKFSIRLLTSTYTSS